MLAIIGVVVGIGITSGDKIVQSARVKATNNKMNAIENALMAFRLKYDRLPCPADITAVKGDADYGVENLNETYMTCASYTTRGTVPAKTLGLPDEYVVDGWGHKFQYRAATTALPFFSTAPLDSSHVSSGESNIPKGMYVNPARSIAATYVLLSHGMNGYGAYNEDGTQNSYTGASSEEEAHILFTAFGGSSVGYYYQQEEKSDGFDDIVRFKERWQMQVPEDAYLPKSNMPQFLSLVEVYYGGVYGSSLLCYHQKGPIFVRGANITSVLPGEIMGYGYTPNNRHIFVYSPVAPYCYLLRIMGTQANYASVPNPVESCPVPVGIIYRAMSDNGYLAFANTSTNTVMLWKLSGDRYRSISSVSPGFTPSTVRFTRGADYMLVGSANTEARIYKRNANGTGFTQMVNQPTVPENAYKAISPDGKYIVAFAPYKLYVWRKESDETLTDLYVTSYITTPVSSSLMVPGFSPDSRYLVLGATSSGTPASVIYRIADDETFNLVSTQGMVGLAGSGIGFDKSSRFLIHGGGVDPVQFRKSADEFVKWPLTTAGPNTPYSGTAAY